MEMFRLVCPSCKIPDCTDSFGNYYEINVILYSLKITTYKKSLIWESFVLHWLKPCGFFNYLLFSIH